MRPDHMMDTGAGAILLILWLIAARFMWARNAKNAYIIFCTVFYIYIIGVLYYTLFQFQSLLVLKYFAPSLRINGSPAEESVNLLPLATLTAGDVTTSLLNILLFVPFGIGLPFISNLRFKGTTAAAMAFSLAIEAAQFVTGYLAGVTLRVADVNDVIFNAVGAMIGYGLFAGLLRAYLRVFPTRHGPFNSLTSYVAERAKRGGRRKESL